MAVDAHDADLDLAIGGRGEVACHADGRLLDDGFRGNRILSSPKIDRSSTKWTYVGGSPKWILPRNWRGKGGVQCSRCGDEGQDRRVARGGDVDVERRGRLVRHLQVAAPLRGVRVSLFPSDRRVQACQA